MPVLVGRAFVRERDYFCAVALVAPTDIETITLVLHDVISDEAPVLRRSIVERQHANVGI